MVSGSFSVVCDLVIKEWFIFINFIVEGLNFVNAGLNKRLLTIAEQSYP